jgi:hypothetical protein
VMMPVPVSQFFFNVAVPLAFYTVTGAM